MKQPPAQACARLFSSENPPQFRAIAGLAAESVSLPALQAELDAIKRPCALGGSLELIAQRVVVATLQSVLLSLPLSRLDQVLQAARPLHSRGPALRASLVALHAHLILPLP